MLRQKISLCILTSIALLGCNEEEKKHAGSPPKIDWVLPKTVQEVRSFGSCSELTSYIQDKTNKIEAIQASYSKYLSDQGIAEADPVSSNLVATNVQESGLDEADVLKSNKDFVFYASLGKIYIHDLQTKALVQTLATEATDAELLVDENHLVAISHNYPNVTVQVFAYDTQTGWKQIKTKKWEGNLVATRLVNHQVVLVTRTWTVSAEAASNNCQNYYYPQIDDLNMDQTTASVVTLQESTADDRDTVLFGGFDDFYAGPEGFYLIRKHLSWFYWDERLEKEESILAGNMAVSRLSLHHGALVPSSAGIVEGHSGSSWAFKEIPDKKLLAVAVGGREGQSWDSDFTNWLSVYDYSSTQIAKKGKTEIFGRNETIRAVRYIGEMAYVVTFRETDPLYTIDLSQPDQPKVLGELHVPGFSSYLHPIGSTGLLGVGFDANLNGNVQGLKLSLFDISDSQNPTEVENLVYGGDGSFSTVAAHHRALFYSSEHKIVGLPYLLRKGGSWKARETGMLMLKVDSTPLALQEEVRLTHSEWVEKKCRTWMSQMAGPWLAQDPNVIVDINRMYIDGDEVVTFSAYGVKVYSMEDYSTELLKIRYQTDGPECRLPQPIGG